MNFYQLSAAFRDLGALRFRALLLVLQILVTSLCLGVTINSSIASAGNIAVANTLRGSDVTYFSLFYDDSLPPDTNEDLDTFLGGVLDGSSGNYSIIRSNYFYDHAITAPVIVALGGFATAYGLDGIPTGRDAVLLGSRVTQYSLGDQLDFGRNRAEVIGRLPAGQAYLDPWMGYENLDQSVVLLSTYSRFAENNPPDVWQQEVVGRTVLIDEGTQFIDEYVTRVASTGGLEVLPRPLEQRVTSIYEAQLNKSYMFLMFFVALLLVMLITLVSSLNTLITSNLRRYAIERLYGANEGHLFLRMQFFLATVFAGPTVLVFLGLSALQQPLQTIFPLVVAVVVITQALLSVHAVRVIRNMSVTALLRKE